MPVTLSTEGTSNVELYLLDATDYHCWSDKLFRVLDVQGWELHVRALIVLIVVLMVGCATIPMPVCLHGGVHESDLAEVECLRDVGLEKIRLQNEHNSRWWVIF